MTKKATPKNSEPSKANTVHLTVTKDRPEDRLMAEAAAGGILSSAFTLVNYSKSTLGELSLSECVTVLGETARAVRGGDLQAAETMLTAQAAALNAIFGELARRAALNMGQHLDATDRYMRLALKAQGQCRATLETLAAIKNPPVVFAKQANINNGGQQQVNNGSAPATPGGVENSLPLRSGNRTASHAGNFSPALSNSNCDDLVKVR